MQQQKYNPLTDALFVILIFAPSISIATPQLVAPFLLVVIASIFAYSHYNSQFHLSTRRTQAVYLPTAVFTALATLPAILAYFLVN